ncbi:uncharacterized protein EAE98_007438 [Botrytis deweyae]|uniref:Anaphase-promoting complex subunit 11 RING-H2 finger domain-containing protein n=1 Tax=Botrytis deweyae TaxID=2478750 RepID=A0ABQ7IHM6_9HELO|nr:uncharacterized protein EAE98_007438 [Botrytis deweyae]KAF7924387.1 hypothetical protein EAE98_007438 [Botrytis deweyae]KAF7936990.1 hypothetical protein EAE99_002339 [Botrytis elliptica]
MLFLVGAVTSFSCEHQYFANLTLHQAGDEEDWRCITGPDTTWTKLDKECPDCRNKVPPTDPVILSRPISPLLAAPEDLEDRRGALTEFRCGHHKVSSSDDKECIVLGVDKLGFLLIRSKKRCPRCIANGIQDNSSDDQTSSASQPDEASYVPLDGSDLEIADNMDMGTLTRQTRQREALATFDHPPTPSRRDSKREKAKKIGKSLWGSIKKKF